MFSTKCNVQTIFYKGFAHALSLNGIESQQIFNSYISPFQGLGTKCPHTRRGAPG